MSSRRAWWILAVITVAAALRLSAALSFARSPLCIHPVLEDAGYQLRALAVSDGALLDPSLPRGSVLYPILASLVPGLRSGGSAPLAVAQSIVEVGTVLLLVLWIRRRWGDVAAAAAGLLYALDPTGAFFAARYSPVTASTLIFLALLCWRDARGPRLRAAPGAIAAGLLAAAGFLLQPLVFLAFAVGHAWDELRSRRWGAQEPAADDRAVPGTGDGENRVRPSPSPRSRWLSSLAPLVAIALVAGLLVARHARLPGGGPILGWGMGPALERAFDPDSRGTPRFVSPPSWLSEADWRDLAWESLARRGTDYDLFRAFTDRGLGQALGHPFATLAVLLAKAAGTVGAHPIPDDLSPSFEAARHARPFAYLFWSFPLLLGLAAAGFVLRTGCPARTRLAQGLAIVAVASMLGMTSAASRQAALPLLAALGGGGIAILATRSRAALRTTRRRALGALVIAVAASLLAGRLGPARALRNPSEDLRLTARAFAATSAWRQAVPLLEEAVRAAPRNLEARVALAEAYRADALPSAASQQLETAYAADSTHAGTLRALAADRQANNRTPEALALMDRLVRRRPNRAADVRELADLWVAVGNYPVAEALLERAVRLDPKDREATEALQQVVSLRMQLETALFPEEIRMGDDPQLYAAIPRAVEAMEAGRWAEADSLLGWIEASYPERATPAWMRAGYLARRGDLEGSIRSLERCQAISPGRPAVVAQLARLYAQTGRGAQMEPLLRASLRAVGADSVEAQQLRLLRSQLGIR